jgi:HNH endonuclease
MPKSNKQAIREAFRRAVFTRASSTCECCGIAGVDRQAATAEDVIALDAHHITDRNTMPNGGYVKENGISVCDTCHQKAEEFHATGVAREGYAPEDLYAIIGSSYEQAYLSAFQP